MVHCGLGDTIHLDSWEMAQSQDAAVPVPQLVPTVVIGVRSVGVMLTPVLSKLMEHCGPGAAIVQVDWELVQPSTEVHLVLQQGAAQPGVTPAPTVA